MLELAGPKVCFVPTASGDEDLSAIRFYESFAHRAYGPELRQYREGLGFLPGSACPHYDSEERRRPVYTQLVGNGFPAGYAAEDGVGLLFEGTELREVVTAVDGARAYRVSAEGEEPLEARPL